MCKMVQEEKKNHALSSNQYLSPYSIQQMWPSIMQFFLLHVKNYHAYGGVYFIRGVRKKKFENCRQRKECLYKDSQHCTNLSTYQQWETGEEVEIKNKNQEQL